MQSSSHHPDNTQPLRWFKKGPIEMAFSSAVSMTGVPDFGIIHINPIETAKAFQSYLDTASKLTGVSLDDIDRGVLRMPSEISKVTLADLINSGMKLFDAVVWLTAGRPSTHPLIHDPGMKKEDIPSMHDIARSVFYCYFMLVTQARYPVSRNTTEKPKIPNFLKTIMGMDKDQHIYVEQICSFEPQKFDPAWARHVTFEGFGQEVLSRFGLGVAGYRLFGPFGLYKTKDDISQDLLPAVTFARNVAKAPASWDVHPLTRNPNILTNRGNLNKNLGNLILDCFTTEQIEEMVKAKIIFAVPTREIAHRNYLQWTDVDDISGSARIFRA
jgi:hypothetical protein